MFGISMVACVAGHWSYTYLCMCRVSHSDGELREYKDSIVLKSQAPTSVKALTDLHTWPFLSDCV